MQGMKTWHIMRGAIFAFGILALVSCGPSSAPIETDNILLRSNSGEPGTLDPHLALTSPERIVINDLFVGLLSQNARGEVIPGLASSYNVSEDGLRWTFVLRDGLKWSDGVALNSSDFIYSLHRALDPQTASPTANALFAIKGAQRAISGDIPSTEIGVSAPDDNTLVFELERPTPYFDKLLLSPSALPVPRHRIEAAGEQWARPPGAVGNGAFVLSEWRPRVDVAIVKNPLFYEQEQVRLDGVTFVPTEDLNTQLRRFRAGEIHLGLNFPPSQTDWVKNNLADSVRIFPILGTYYYPFNLSSPKLQDVRTRRALTIAVDREIIAQQVLTSGETPAYTMVSGHFENYSDITLPEYARTPIEARQIEARELLAQAGFDDANPLELEIRYNMTEEHQAIALAISSMWNAVGVKTDLLSTETRTHFRDLQIGEYEVARTAIFPSYNDPVAILTIFDGGNSSENYSGYDNPEFDQMIGEANALGDPGLRAQKLREAEALALADYPVLPIYHYVSKRLVSPQVKGWEDNSMGTHLSRYLSIETSDAE